MNAFAITDLEKFAVILRRNAAESLAHNYTENLDDFISISQVVSIVKFSRLNHDAGDVMINEDILADLLEEISDIIYQVGLSKLCADDKIECAWDNKSNSMVFWQKDTN